MRTLDKIIVHCSDTPKAMDIGVKEIRVWHVKDNGWSDIGYHYVIKQDGTVEEGRPLRLAGAHCKGYNSTSIGICLIGRDSFTAEQFQSLNKLIKRFQKEFGITDVKGHCYYDNGKTCPNFNVEEELMKLSFSKDKAKEALLGFKDAVVKPVTKKRVIVLALVACFAAVGINLDETSATVLVEVASSLI